MTFIFFGGIALLVLARLKGWLTFYRPQSPSPFHLQLTVFGVGVTIKEP